MVGVGVWQEAGPAPAYLPGQRRHALEAMVDQQLRHGHRERQRVETVRGGGG